MIRTGICLALAEGRSSIVRIGLTVLSITVGVVVLLVVVSIEPAITAREGRIAQREPTPSSSELRPDRPAADETFMTVTDSHVGSRRLTIVHVAPGSPTAPTPVGLGGGPSVGEVVVSPALADLLVSPDAALVRPRLQGEVADTAAVERALVHPDELVAWVGHTPAELADAARVAVVSAFPLPPPDRDWWTNKTAVWVGISLLALALMVPVLIMVGVLARLGAAERERRLATLRLIGATPTQTVRLAAVEAATIATVGVGVGVAVFFAVRHAIATITFARAAWFASDFTPHPAALALVLVGVPAASAATAAFTLRRVVTSPLGIHRPDPTTPATSRWWPAALVAVGVAGLALTGLSGSEFSSGMWMTIAGVSFLALLVGLPATGPWLVATLASRLAQRAPNASTLLAANRSAADPRGAFRASIGVLLGMFVITAIYGYTAGNLGTLGATWFDGAADVTISSLGPTPAQTVGDLRHLPGVDHVLATTSLDIVDGFDVTLATCDQVAAFDLANPHPCPGSGVWLDPDLPDIGAAPGATITLSDASRQQSTATTDLVLPDDIGTLRNPNGRIAGLVIDPALVPDQFEEQLASRRVLLRLDDDPATLEQVRNTVIATHPGASIDTPDTLAAEFDSPLVDARRIVTLAAALTILVTAISLVAAITGRMLEQRRQLTLLRTIGTPPTTLLATVLLETAVPVALAILIGTTAGLLTASAFVAALGGNYTPPITDIGALALAALTTGSVLVVVAFPIINRATTPRNLRTT